MSTERAIVLAAALLGAAALAEEKTMTTFNFDSDTAGQLPKGFHFGLTGKGKPGNWIVQTADDAPSGKNVLAQTDGDATDYRFPLAFAGPEMKDLRLSVKCKPIAGKGDQGCGIVWRLKDADNYYITRANALEDNVHLYAWSAANASDSRDGTGRSSRASGTSWRWRWSATTSRSSTTAGR